jgi:hypothetical protein
MLRIARAVSLAMVAGVLLSGCSRPPADLPGEQLEAPEGSFYHPVWMPDGWIYFNRILDDVGLEVADRRQMERTVWRTKPGTPAEALPLPEIEGCILTKYGQLHRLPDDRLGMARECGGEDTAGTWWELVALDVDTGDLEVLVKDMPPVGNVAWFEDMSGGYLTTGGSCSGIAPFDEDGVRPLPGPITIDGHTWRLDEAVIRRLEGYDCSDEGVVRRVAITPDAAVVFFAAPDAQGRSGRARGDTLSNLYVWSPDGQPQRVASRFSEEGGIAAAPDGDSVVVAAEYRGRRGIYQVYLTSGEVQELGRGSSRDVTIAPSGSAAVASFLPPDGPVEEALFHMELRLLPLHQAS